MRGVLPVEINIHELLPQTIAQFRPFNFKLLGIPFNLDITTHVVALWFSALIVFLLLFAGTRRRKLVPGRWQNAMESVLETIRDGMVLEIIGPEGRPYFPLIATLFLFILVSNLVGMVPPLPSATGLLGTTVAWGLMVFVIYNTVAIRKHGVVGFAKSFVPSGTPIALAPFVGLLEFISNIVRPFSLGIRLFANMLAGHMVLLVFTVMTVSLIWWGKWLPFVAVILFRAFEVFVAILQAYIFAVLTGIYISLAIHEH